MSTLVTGGTGFVGSHLVKKLVEKGCTVIVFDMSKPESTSSGLEDVKFVTGDMTNLNEILETIKKHDVEDIYHLATVMGDVCDEEPLLGLRVNVLGTLNVLEAAKVSGQVKTVVFASSQTVFGDDVPEPVDDDALKNPKITYGITKLVSERYGLHYANTFGVDFRAVRFTYVYGPGRSTRGLGGFCTHLIERPALGLPYNLPFSDGRINWLYIEDAVRALILAHDAVNPEHRIYNTPGEAHSISEVISIVREFIPDAKIEFGKRPLMPFPASYSYLRARSELGWEPLYTVREGIKDFITRVRLKQRTSDGVLEL